MKRFSYIAIAGNIGSGKSSLVEFICRTCGVRPFFEPNADNPYLTKFYGDMKRWAFHSQLYYLAHKFRIHQELDKKRQTETIILDRTIFEDAEIFATYLRRRRFISTQDWSVYQALYKTILEAIPPPDLLIYLRASVKTLRKRIRSRGRPEEQNINPSYLRSLNQLYEEWFTSYKRSQTLVLETDRFDYVQDLLSRIDILKLIKEHIVQDGASQSDITTC